MSGSHLDCQNRLQGVSIVTDMTNPTPNTPVLESFEQWKDFLSKQVNNAKSAGASEDTIVNAATRIGHFLAEKVDPRNREQRLLKEMWDVGTEDERKSMMSLITKMVSDGKVH